MKTIIGEREYVKKNRKRERKMKEKKKRKRKRNMLKNELFKILNEFFLKKRWCIFIQYVKSTIIIQSGFIMEKRCTKGC